MSDGWVVVLGLGTALLLFGIGLQHWREVRQRKLKADLLAEMEQEMRRISDAMTKIADKTWPISRREARRFDRLKWEYEELRSRCEGLTARREALK